MKHINLKLVSATLLAVLLLGVFPVTAFAATPKDLVVGNNYTLESGKILNNDLLVLGGNVDLQKDSIVTGSVIIFGGNCTAAGTINGDLVVLGGTINLASTFVLQGNLTSAGGSVNRAPGAQINGQVNTNISGPSVILPGGVRFPVINATYNPAVKVAGYFVGLILWSLVAMLLAMFLPNPLTRTYQTEISEPLISGGLGCLTIIIVPIVLVLLAITICLSPVALLGAFVLAAAWAYGLIAMGLEVGRRISLMFKHEWHPAISAGVGTLVLMAILTGLQTFLPCIGWIPMFVAGIVGLGAVLLTQFGRKPYVSGTRRPAVSSSEILPPAGGSDLNPPANQ
ncbi:MAG: hypothetical protein C3F13_05835 [Anaerolineales bacterium]|nr:MAG: hypothetical protein C3F13_05835 [Anaerolineales bacterium]